jgi:exoribonuclease II
MPKLPANYVKAPSFDNPLRATTGKHALMERKVVFQMDELMWNAVQAACEREETTPEALIQRALERWMAEPQVKPAVVAAPRVEAPASKQSLREQFMEKLQERLGQRSWVQRLLTLREVLRETRV